MGCDFGRACAILLLGVCAVKGGGANDRTPTYGGYHLVRDFPGVSFSLYKSFDLCEGASAPSFFLDLDSLLPRH